MINPIEIEFKKYSDGLVPAIVQDAQTHKVLMQGYMNKEALQASIESKKVTFFSRSKNRLWTKGEESGNFLNLVHIAADCDRDALLIKAIPVGPVCHTGADTCWQEKNEPANFLYYLQDIITQRRNSSDDNSYTKSLFEKGINKIAQKVGEEAVEIVIEAKDNNDELFKGEAADLLFHYLILLQAKGFTLQDIETVLKERHNK